MKHLASKYNKKIIYIFILSLCTCVDYALVFGMNLKGVLPIASVTIGHLFAIALNFFLQKAFTFSDVKFYGIAQVIRYFFVVFVIWFITIIVVEISLHFFLIHVLIGKLIAQPITFITGYYLMRYFVFPQSPPVKY